MAQSGKRVRFEQHQMDESTPTKGPVDEANTSRSSGLLSLATSFLEIPSFMEELSKQNILLHNQIQRKNITIDHLKNDDTVPRSLRFKFDLQVPSASPALLNGFQAQCNEALKTSQTTIKQVIVDARNHELKELQIKQGQICASFLCNSAKAYMLVTDQYTHVNACSVCSHVMTNPAVNAMFSALDADARKLELEKWFPDVAQAIDADIRKIPAAVAFAEFLIKIVEKCLYFPIQKYNEAKTRAEKITALRKLNASVLVTKKTEDTVMQLDQEATITPKLLDQLIAEKVKKETARQLKNNS